VVGGDPNRRLAALTLNMIEPIPPAPRNTSSCQYDCASRRARLEPRHTDAVASMTRSPNAFTSRPKNGAIASPA